MEVGSGGSNADGWGNPVAVVLAKGSFQGSETRK
jgi:hypothetical protein